jgi:beta-galactosidase/beta-glucuronidase
LPTPRSEYPRPQLRRENHWINLNGIWEFELDHGRSGVARNLPKVDQLAGTILVPFAPESELSGVGHKDFIAACWYRRKLEIPEDWAGRRVVLHIGACDFDCRVYLEGRELAHHRGGYTPFSVDLTEALGGRRYANLTLGVEDDVRSGAQAKGKQAHLFASNGWDYTRTTGLWQTVWLESLPECSIGTLRLTPRLSDGGLLIEARLDSRHSHPGLRLKARAEAGEFLAGSAEVTADTQSASLFLPLQMLHPWSPEDPFLYDLRLSLVDRHGHEIDVVDSYFGMRSLAINGYALELNGQPYFQRLILDQGYYPDGIYTAPSDEHLRRDIELAKSMGFNGARLHQKVFEPRFLYWCDRLGYLAWGECPDWGLDVTKADGLAAFMTNWVEQLERDYSHPSVVGWMPFNEHDTGTNPEAFRALYRMTRALDPTRPCIDSSGWMHVETCIYDVHDYAQDPRVLEERYRPLLTGEGEIYRNLDIVERNAVYRTGQPYFVSEFGGIWWNPGQSQDDPAWGYGRAPASSEEFRQRFQGLVEVLLAHPRMCGFCYTQLTDVEQEVNGLCDDQRRPKFETEWIRSIVSQPAAIERGQVHTLHPPALEEQTAACAQAI